MYLACWRYDERCDDKKTAEDCHADGKDDLKREMSFGFHSVGVYSGVALRFIQDCAEMSEVPAEE